MVIFEEVVLFEDQKIKIFFFSGMVEKVSPSEHYLSPYKTPSQTIY
jgi:hypothetical protein